MTIAFKLTAELLEDFTAADASNVTWSLFLHSRHADVMAVCEELAKRPNVTYYPYGENRGFSRSFNMGIQRARELGADTVMHLSDDMLSGAGDIQRVAQTCVDHPECSYVDGLSFVEISHNWQPAGLDAAALNWRAIDAIGFFDCNFHPLNFEDIDWKRRASLAGYEPITLADTHFIHRNANILKTSAEEHDTRMAGFYRTRDYYVQKWGGDQRLERYSVPFNDPACDLTIPESRIHDPYPEYRRTDIPETII